MAKEVEEEVEKEVEEEVQEGVRKLKRRGAWMKEVEEEEEEVVAGSGCDRPRKRRIGRTLFHGSTEGEGC